MLPVELSPELPVPVKSRHKRAKEVLTAERYEALSEYGRALFTSIWNRMQNAGKTIKVIPDDSLVNWNRLDESTLAFAKAELTDLELMIITHRDGLVIYQLPTPLCAEF